MRSDASRSEAVPSESVRRTLQVYHDGELGRFSRWRFERRLGASEALARELADLELMGSLVREHDAEADSPDLWGAIAARLPAAATAHATHNEPGALMEHCVFEATAERKAPGAGCRNAKLPQLWLDRANARTWHGTAPRTPAMRDLWAFFALASGIGRNSRRTGHNGGSLR